ncbi:MAG TPA: toll/interleukin-1 receptor domain-containing protein, partial [Nitrospira sp.]|nr:toll/interleukin-1 receptor domain-containing protein [Nitrospira sp.]
MPSVFLSYSRADVPLIEQLVAHFRDSSPEVLIWRDQEKIYGGQKWPKILGEAIADQNVFLLAWSKNAASSHFVELEWNTAIALKKPIIPCLLDDTPLAPSLRAFHGYSMQDVAGLTTSLATAPPVDQSRRTPVLAKLDDITSLDKTAVLAQAKAVFAQQQWTVQGNVYQAGGDIHIHNEPSASSTAERTKPLVQPWQAWVSLAVAVLTTVILLLDLPANWGEPT